MKEKRHLGNFYHVLKLFLSVSMDKLCACICLQNILPQTTKDNSQIAIPMWIKCSELSVHLESTYVLFILLVLSNVERDKSNISSRQSSVVPQLNPRDNHIND